MVKGVTFLTLI